MSETYDFSETLGDLDAGIFLQKLSRAVRETASGVVYHGDKGKKGKVVIELTMERIADSRQVQVAHKLSWVTPTKRGKASEEDVTTTPLYVGRDGILTFSQPDQADMFRQKKETV